MKKLLLALFLILILVFSSCNGNDDGAADIQATQGLVYAVNAQGSREVIGYKGSDTDIIIPDEYDGLPVTAVANSAFAGNCEITSLTLGANVKVIEAAAFVGCEKLDKVNLDGSLEIIGNAAFFGCASLKSVSLPVTVKQIGIDCFADCPSIEQINYGGNESAWNTVDVAPNNSVFDTKLVLAGGEAVVRLIDKGDCNANVSWHLGYDGILYLDGNGHIPDYAFDEIPWREHYDSILKVVVGEGIDIIGKNAFLGCFRLAEAELAPSVRLIDDGAFYGCKALSKITLPERLRRIGESAFFGCESIEEMNIPESVTAIGSGAFMGCTALKEVKMSSAVTSIERWCFAGCSSLKTIDLANVKSVGANAFFGCDALDK